MIKPTTTIAPTGNTKSMDEDQAFRELLDKACDQFEEDWQHDRLPKIDAVLSGHEFCQLTCQSPERRELLLALIALEMEYSLRKQATNQPLEEYTRKFSELTTDDVTKLAIKEYRYRQQWGDRPSLYEFFERFPELRGKLEGPLREYASRITPTILGVYQNQELIYEMRLAERLEIGRQQRNDPAPISMCESASGSRLVLAGGDQRMISRRQFVIETVARDGLRVTNSGHNSIEVELYNPLAAGDSIILTRPTVLKVADYAIRLSQP